MSLEKITIRTCIKPFVKQFRQVVKNFLPLLSRKDQRSWWQMDQARLSMKRYRRRKARRQE